VKTTGKLNVPARIVVVAPPAGVVFALQRGKRDLSGAALSRRTDLRFDFTLQVSRAPARSIRFSGEFVQGPAGGKFVYVNSGTLAGDAPSPWTRRAKVGLKGMKWSTVERVLGQPGAFVQARISGTARDGGPACASVPLLDAGWTVEADPE
jgi:hypothetical protein